MSWVGFNIEGMMKKLRDAPKKIERVMQTIEPKLRAELARSIKAGTDTYGEPWKLTKDGRKPLRNAMQAVRTERTKGIIKWSITGPEARHHYGAVRAGKQIKKVFRGSGVATKGKKQEYGSAYKGNVEGAGIKRPIIPTKQIPKTWRAIIEAEVLRELLRIF